MKNIRSYTFKEGATLLIDKPKTWTSFDVVNKIRYRVKRILNVKKIKVGHAGTLDPMATGLLILCTGKFTKKINEYQGMEKEYTGTLKLGETTPSYDAETEVDETFEINHINEDLIYKTTHQFIGELDQVPPIFSAIKVDGQPLYKRARKGQEVEIKSRKIKIFDFEITKIEMPFVSFRVRCSKGTYIRSLAYDFGQALNSGAYLTELCRTKIGEYALEDAWELEHFIQEIEAWIEEREE